MRMAGHRQAASDFGKMGACFWVAGGWNGSAERVESGEQRGGCEGATYAFETRCLSASVCQEPRQAESPHLGLLDCGSTRLELYFVGAGPGSSLAESRELWGSFKFGQGLRWDYSGRP